MLTNYDYTIDYTSDAGGAAETWGTEAGHGIISAAQMLAWVEENCGEACPGDPGGEKTLTKIDAALLSTRTLMARCDGGGGECPRTTKNTLLSCYFEHSC